MITDWECLDLARSGDGAAWRTLYERHYVPLVKMTSCITGSFDAAQDLVQETFVRLLHCRLQHRSGNFHAFITTIAYRLALKENSRRRVRLRSRDYEVTDDTPSPLEKVIADETDRLVIHAIASLPVEQREVVALRFFSGHTYEEIADILEVPVGTVKSRIFYAIRNCQERLREKGILL